MSTTEEAEREASEVLHTLLSVERIDVKSPHASDRESQPAPDSIPLHQWHTPVTTALGNASTSNNLSSSLEQLGTVELSNLGRESPTSSSDTVDVEFTDPNEDMLNFNALLSPAKCPTPKPTQPHKQTIRKRVKPPSEVSQNREQHSMAEVRQRLEQGCECQGDCFSDMQPENVHQHRLNVAELAKEEHDMYLMGLTMACLANRKETGRHKERIRQRATYVYHGKRVCLDAFIYLENVTQYHLKRIRHHVMVNGVRPRVHGNQGKKPHNTFPLDMDKKAETFVRSVLVRQRNESEDMVILNESRATIYQKFKQQLAKEGRTMGYSSFRNFLKKQFPRIRFVPKPGQGH